ncbi:MAG TPA: PaaI family thioesterase [Spirochaetota bacterium]|nr:PaaI family thioesterase [Spirochaetota bacterium]
MNRADFIKIPNTAHNTCFGCGPANHKGLGMEFHGNDKLVFSEMDVPDYMAGWNGVVHGGILSTMLDEVMAWGAIFLTEKFILTKTMTVTYHKPTLMHERLRAEAEIDARTSEREVVMKGCIINSKGEVSASATGVFALFSPESIKKIGIIDAKQVEEFVEIMNSHSHLK